MSLLAMACGKQSANVDELENILLVPPTNWYDATEYDLACSINEDRAEFNEFKSLKAFPEAGLLESDHAEFLAANFTFLSLDKVLFNEGFKIGDVVSSSPYVGGSCDAPTIHDFTSCRLEEDGIRFVKFYLNTAYGELCFDRSRYAVGYVPTLKQRTN